MRRISPNGWHQNKETQGYTVTHCNINPGGGGGRRENLTSEQYREEPWTTGLPHISHHRCRGKTAAQRRLLGHTHRRRGVRGPCLLLRIPCFVVVLLRSAKCPMDRPRSSSPPRHRGESRPQDPGAPRAPDDRCRTA